MKLLSVLSFLLFFSSIHLHAQRDRVQILDGTLVTDKGTLLRGACFSTDISDYIPSEEEVACIKELGLNTLHLYAECEDMTDYPGQNYIAVDSIVNMTERDSLYIAYKTVFQISNNFFIRNRVHILQIIICNTSPK